MAYNERRKELIRQFLQKRIHYGIIQLEKTEIVSAQQNSLNDNENLVTNTIICSQVL